jgi:uncharacterized protein YndB with AHSA1/START domain
MINKEKSMPGNNVQVDKEKLEIRMSRVLDAPRERVWEAHIDPKAIEQWWGPRRYKTKVEKLEPKVGGKWKFINVDTDGTQHVFYGEFLEIVKPEKLTWTFTYEPYPQSVAIDALNFEELPDGKTKLTSLSTYPSIEALEGMLQGGMTEGATETWDRLEELVTKK